MKVSPKAFGGFALMEVMIALFVLAVGILGAGAMQSIGIQATFGSYNRTQAMILAGDIVDRIRANRAQRASYNNIDTNNPPTPAASCLTAASGCAPSQIVQLDAAEWAKAFQNLRIPNGRGRIVRTGTTDNYVVTVNWSETVWDEGNTSRSSQLQTYQLAVTL